MSDVKIAMIAAVGDNGAIGAEGRLPWRLPTDFAFYKAHDDGQAADHGAQDIRVHRQAAAGADAISW